MEEKYPRDDEKSNNSTEEKSQQPWEKEDEKFEREFYEPATTAQASNIIGWSIAIFLFALAIWLLWTALK